MTSEMVNEFKRKGFWWRATCDSGIEHAWKTHTLTPMYLQSACGDLIAWDYKHQHRGKRQCKKCLQIINSI